MRRRGVFRLWVVLTVIFVPGLAFWMVHGSMATWDKLDRISIEQCGTWVGGSPPDYKECIHNAGADQTMFQHEHTTPGRYWGMALGIALLFDLIITALLVGAFYAGRWVVRGFKAEPK
jgi:hypothetical protein